ncbi:hypothetical protein [Nostoc sp.]
MSPIQNYTSPLNTPIQVAIGKDRLLAISMLSSHEPSAIAHVAQR